MSNVNTLIESAYATPYLITIVMLALSVTVLDILAIEMYVTFINVMVQGQI